MGVGAGLLTYAAAYITSLDGAFGPVEYRPGTVFWMVLDAVCLLACVPLYLRRYRSPLLVTGLLVIVGSFSVLASGLVLLAVVSLATRRRWSEILPVYALWLGAMLVGERAFSAWVVVDDGTAGTDELWTVIMTAAFAALVVVTGMFIGGRRALVTSLREQAAIARREADALDDSARASERNRIAREMHDVLAHRLSLVALHSGALEYRTGLDPEQVRQTAAVVRENAHEALGELREVLGLLREPSPADEQSRPQPTFAQVQELVDDARAAGSPVTVELDRVAHDDLARLPASTSRHLYRVVQETLTNARKHAPGAPVHVRVHGAPGERVALEVSNPVPPTAPATRLPSSGWGLTGLAERLRLTGGELDAGARADGTFTVRAWLPWAAAPEEAA
ncbi:two-component sensor histidine kinase [Cellulomonas sp. zg-ZUI222]|uniref:histidine kinase n=2 Tax=Cellulomonadaceae TaxID=85016 RepID=A0ABX8DCI9_9CELL|nr:two-component sensor histidine kinase [Cellulomonas sp. zg-ZUI22]MBO0922549.1 two-component sensor histidine kinase [Cellulomonas wangleii]MBO0926746.1 two-component sensor histidine kinase [Cellulomonas wangleii]QVI64082.1 two-component sensor histidine kinase [Cellulomonas wangleii]